MTAPRGYIRPRGGKLEAVLVLPDGSKKTRTTGLDVGQEAEAEAVLAEALRTLQEPAGAPLVAGTVREWGERWIEDRKARGKLEYVYERGHLAHFLYPKLGGKQLVDVTDVELIDWARGLEKMRGPSGKTPAPKYVRKITATVRAMFKEAVRRHVIERTPCVWEDSDLPEFEANARIISDGFDAGQVAQIIRDPRVPEDRRVRYAVEFLTGLRPGEAAARRWADWEPVYRDGPLGRLVVKTAYNTRHRILKATKTRVEKWIPVHPELARILQRWKDEGWERFNGRPPTPEDLMFPAHRGGVLNNSYTWRCFRDDLEELGIPHQRHYESRSTFINLAEGAGADPHWVAKITHPSVRDAKDLYSRARQYWPRLCDAVTRIVLPATSGEGFAVGVAVPGGGGAAVACSVSSPAGFGETGEYGRARESNPPAAPFSTTHRF